MNQQRVGRHSRWRLSVPKLVLAVFVLAILITVADKVLPKPKKSVAVAEGIDLLPTKEDVDDMIAEALGNPAVEQSLSRRVSPQSRGIQANLSAAIVNNVISNRIQSKTTRLDFGTNIEILGATDNGPSSADRGNEPMKKVRVLDGKHAGKIGRVRYGPYLFAPPRSVENRRDDLERQAREEAAAKAATKKRNALEQAEHQRAVAAQQATERAIQASRKREQADMRAKETARMQAEDEAKQRQEEIAKETAKAESIFYTESSLPKSQQRSIEQIADLFRHRTEVLAALRNVKAKFDATEKQYRDR